MDQLDGQLILRSALQYLVEGLAVGLACYYIPRRTRLNLSEILMISITAAAVFAILQMYMPGVYGATKLGLGLGIGMNMAGLNAAGGNML